MASPEGGAVSTFTSSATSPHECRCVFSHDGLKVEHRTAQAVQLRDYKRLRAPCS